MNELKETYDDIQKTPAEKDLQRSYIKMNVVKEYIKMTKLPKKLSVKFVSTDMPQDDSD